MKPRWLAFVVATTCLYAAPATAHSFGKLYNLPIPFWLYLYGAAAALLLSFLVIGYFVSARSLDFLSRTRELRWIRPGRKFPERSFVGIARLFSVAMLLFCVLSGFIGTQFSYYNFNMTFFWVIFVLGLTYAAALLGDVYVAVNPWRTLAGWVSVIPGLEMRGRVRYPAAWGSYPALLFYFAFIWFELFGHCTPRVLSAALLGYTVANLLGAWLVGPMAWFGYCEFFSVFFRLVAKISPLEWVIGNKGGQLRLRQPFMGLLKEAPADFSLLLFVLFMLSSTAFDGLHETVAWSRGFWVHIYGLLTPALGTNIVDTYPTFRVLHLAYEYLGLLLSPFFYLLVYLLFLAIARWLSASRHALRELALRFAHALIPIALVYNISHYFTLLVTQGSQVVRLASDPFGFGWNLFGTAHWLAQPLMVGMGVVWHTQVALIIGGHIISVYLAHLEALRLFPSRRQVIVSQLPMLCLMMAYTTIGLWILSQPITTVATQAG